MTSKEKEAISRIRVTRFVVSFIVLGTIVSSSTLTILAAFLLGTPPLIPVSALWIGFIAGAILGILPHGDKDVKGSGEISVEP